MHKPVAASPHDIDVRAGRAGSRRTCCVYATSAPPPYRSAAGVAARCAAVGAAALQLLASGATRASWAHVLAMHPCWILSPGKGTRVLTSRTQFTIFYEAIIYVQGYIRHEY